MEGTANPELTLTPIFLASDSDNMSLCLGADGLSCQVTLPTAPRSYHFLEALRGEFWSLVRGRARLCPQAFRFCHSFLLCHTTVSKWNGTSGLVNQGIEAS